MEDLLSGLEAWIGGLLGDPAYAGVLAWAIAVAAVVVVAWVANFVVKRLLVRGLHAAVSRTRAEWDDALTQHQLFERLAHLAPALVVYGAAPLLFPTDEQESWRLLVQRLANVWMIVAGARAVSALIDGAVTVSSNRKATRGVPVRSYAQLVKLMLWLAVGIFVIATLINRSPWGLLTGLGAMAAILLLVFKDTILGLVASIQIATYDIARVGDWIEMPGFGADGDVMDISLHTVTVRNWDKTVVTIPTHQFLNGGLKNWRGMFDSGGRRIKRSLMVDMSTVRFLGEEDLERLKKVQYIQDYLDEKVKEVQAWNQEHEVDESSLVNGRRLTNLGTFRAYVVHYLENHPQISGDMTFLVRHLQPGPEGLPIEIYVFSTDQRWAHYEAIMADIFDHLLAVVPEFDLRVFQKPSGADLRGLRVAGAAGAAEAEDAAGDEAS